MVRFPRCSPPVAVVVAFVLVSCQQQAMDPGGPSAHRPAVANEQAATFLGRPPLGFPTGFTHPAFSLNPRALHKALASLYYKNTGRGDMTPQRIFDAGETDRLAYQLSRTFQRATADQLVVFQSQSRKNGWSNMTPRFTSGVAFVKDGRIHFVFGNVNVDPAVEPYRASPMLIFNSEKWELVKQRWQHFVMDPSTGHVHYNWLALELRRYR